MTFFTKLDIRFSSFSWSRSSCITSHHGNLTRQVQACCQCNYTALLELSGLDPNDIVFGTFHSAVSKTKLRGPYPSNFSRDFGLDTEGLNLVGRSSSGLHCEHCPHGYVAPTVSSPDGSPICLESSVSFQEEMDQKCMEGSSSEQPEVAPGVQRWLRRCLTCVCECYCGDDREAIGHDHCHTAAVCLHCMYTFYFLSPPFFVNVSFQKEKKKSDIFCHICIYFRQIYLSFSVPMHDVLRANDTSKCNRVDEKIK